MNFSKVKPALYHYYIYIFYSFLGCSFFITLLISFLSRKEFSILSVFIIISFCLICGGICLFVYKQFKKKFAFEKYSTNKSVDESLVIIEAFFLYKGINFEHYLGIENKLIADVVENLLFIDSPVKLTIYLSDNFINYNINPVKNQLILFSTPKLVSELLLALKP